MTAADPVVGGGHQAPGGASPTWRSPATLAWALRDRPRVAVAAALGVALVPVTWYVSAWWGQFESIYALFGLLAAVLALRGPLGRSPGSPSAWRSARSRRRCRSSSRSPPSPSPGSGRDGRVVRSPRRPSRSSSLWLPFLPDGGPAAYLGTIGGLQGDEFAVLSLRAWNPWWILQSSGRRGRVPRPIPTPVLGPLTPRLIGYLAAGLGMAGVFLLVLRERRRRGTLLLGLAAAVLVAFCLLTTMHERYSFAAVVFLARAARRPAARPSPG